MTKRILLGVVLLTGSSFAFATPVTYSFSTGILDAAFFCGSIPNCSPHPRSSFSSSASVQGAFVYDPSVAQTLSNSDGSAIFGGNPSSFSALSGTVDGHSFSDVRGFTQVGNETFSLFDPLTNTTSKVDFLGLTAEPALSSPNPHNLTGFSVDGWSLVNVRLFWIEGTTTPELVPDLTSDQSHLPGVLPAFHGRLALDFVPVGNTNLSYSPASIFFNGVAVSAVPEPQSYVMVLLGLALIGWHMRSGQQKISRPL